MKAIAEEYMTRMGFNNNLYCIFQHHEAGHPHYHFLAWLNRFAGTVVSDIQNYWQSTIHQHNTDRRVQDMIREIINGINAQKETLTKIMDDQQKLGIYLISKLPSLEMQKAQITKLQTSMDSMYTEQKMLQKIWITIFLVFAIPGAAAATTLILLYLFLR